MKSTRITPAISVVLLSLCATSHGLAFHSYVTSSGRRKVDTIACKAQHQQEEGVAVSRRKALASSFLPLLLLPLPSHATATTTIVGGATQSARVETWPGIEGLEPMYEFKLSIDALTKGVSEPKNWPFIQKRLDKFFSGFIVNEKNFYLGVGLQYMNDIQYDKGELPNYVVIDKEARFDALDRTMKDLEALKASLEAGDASAIESYATSAQNALASWFALIPPSDVKAVEELFVNVQKADTNRDGRLSDDELSFLPIPQQDSWKRKVDKFG